jgi:hypothetical protein
MTILDLAIIGLGVYRLSYGLVNERGLVGIFLKIRQMFGYIYDDDDELISIPVPSKTDSFLNRVRNEFGVMISCILCTSLFLSIIIFIIYLINPIYTVYIMLPFAIASITLLLYDK